MYHLIELYIYTHISYSSYILICIDNNLTWNVPYFKELPKKKRSKWSPEQLEEVSPPHGVALFASMAAERPATRWRRCGGRSSPRHPIVFPWIKTDINGLYHLSIVNGYIGPIYIYIYHLRIVNISGYQWCTTHFWIEISERPTIFLWNGLYTICRCGPDGV